MFVLLSMSQYPASSSPSLLSYSHRSPPALTTPPTRSAWTEDSPARSARQTARVGGSIPETLADTSGTSSVPQVRMGA